LRDLGWGEGQNVVIERRNAEGHEERLPGLAEELINLKVDVILASGGPAGVWVCCQPALLRFETSMQRKCD